MMTFARGRIPPAGEGQLAGEGRATSADAGLLSLPDPVYFTPFAGFQEPCNLRT